MATFRYTARDSSGQLSSGVIAAKDQAEVREVLRHKNLYLTAIREQTAKSSASASSPGLFRRRKIRLGDLVVMSRQLATMVRAGLSIVECLQDVAEQTENPVLKETLNQVRLDILTGTTMTDAMRKHPKVFNESYVSLVQAGEAGGLLEQTLETAALQLDREAELVEKVKSAFVYPMVVVFTSIGVVFFMLVFIVPVFAGIYDQFHAKLPPITLLLVFLSYALLHYWWLAAIGLATCVMLARRFHRTPKGRRTFDRIKLKLPLLGKLNRKIAVSRFTQTFASSVRAGVPILRALAISAQTSGNTIIMDAVGRAAGFVKDGASLSVPLEQSGEFPSMVTRMVAAGEHSGNLDAMLEEITRFYNRDIEYTVAKLTRIIEPLMTIVVGGIVLFILLALYMPVFNLTQVVRSK